LKVRAPEIVRDRYWKNVRLPTRAQEKHTDVSVCSEALDFFWLRVFMPSALAAACVISARYGVAIRVQDGILFSEIIFFLNFFKIYMKKCVTDGPPPPVPLTVGFGFQEPIR
jgi:hypothetical protein